MKSIYLGIPPCRASIICKNQPAFMQILVHWGKAAMQQPSSRVAVVEVAITEAGLPAGKAEGAAAPAFPCIASSMKLC